MQYLTEGSSLHRLLTLSVLQPGTGRPGLRHCPGDGGAAVRRSLQLLGQGNPQGGQCWPQQPAWGQHQRVRLLWQRMHVS